MIMQLLQLIVMGDFIYHYIQWYVNRTIRVHVFLAFVRGYPLSSFWWHQITCKDRGTMKLADMA